VIRLHDLLAKAFPACRTNHTLAALEMHTVISVNGAGPRSIKITSERVHDGPVFQVGKWVQDRLLVFDLAYFRYQLFSCIGRNGGYFIVRLKKSADPVIVEANRKWRGASVPVVGRKVSEVIERLQRETLDVVVEVAFKRRVSPLPDQHPPRPALADGHRADLRCSLGDRAVLPRAEVAFGAEIFRDYYSSTREIIHYQYLFGGGDYGSSPIAGYGWAAFLCSLSAFLLFLIPKTRMNLVTLNIGAVLIYAGVYIEKGVALVIPGFSPSTLGEIYHYAPNSTELRVSMGVFAFGAILLTLMVRIAMKFLFANPALQDEHH
jgi:hypothetical protein